MAVARVTMYFQQGSSGWSETWWYPPGRNTTFWSKLSDLAYKRVDMLAANHALTHVRVTDEGANRFTRLFIAGKTTRIDGDGTSINLPGKGKEDGAGGSIEGPPDQVRACVHNEIVVGGQRAGLRYLAGIPDDISQTEPETLNPTFTKFWYALYSAWRLRIITDGWAIKNLAKGVDNPLIDVVTYRIRAAAPSVLGVVIPGAAAFAGVPPQKVLLQGVRMIRKGLDSPNGTWIIDGVEPDTPVGQRTIWLRGTAGFDPTDFFTLGKVRLKTDQFTLPTWIEPIRVGIHKRGRPFGAPVGRRPTRFLRRS